MLNKTDNGQVGTSEELFVYNPLTRSDPKSGSIIDRKILKRAGNYLLGNYNSKAL